MLSIVCLTPIIASLLLSKEVVAYTQTTISFERGSLTSYRQSLLFAEEKQSSFIPSLPSNPFENILKGSQSFFGSSSGGSKSANDDIPTEFEPTPRGLIFQAKRLVASDFGLLDPSVLDDTQFRWIDANSNTAVALTKTEYIAAGRFFNLRGAFPDIDYRAHDYRVVENDDDDADTVRLTCRVQGTMRGELRLRDGIVAPPSGLRMKCPPEAITIKFDLDTGKVIKLCTGFGLDRLVGNTAGTTGVVAASIIAGQPAVSDWDLYPATTILQRVFARPAKRLDDAESFLAPFPEQVMIQLAKGALSSNLGSDDPSLLSDKEFTFMTPTVGPIRKKEFLAKYAAAEFSNIDDPQFSAFRVDPYDPVRVWVDLQPTAPGFEGPPQSMSLAFDDDGYCTRITSWAIMDPSIGNSGGLGGPEGYKYATGTASLSLTSRSFPSILERFKKRVLSPITGISVDEYAPASGAKPVKRIPRAPSAEPPLVAAKQAVADDDAKAAAIAVMKRLENLGGEISRSIRIQPLSIPSISIRPPNMITKSVEEKEKERLTKVEALKRQQEIREQRDKKEKMEKEQKAKQLAAAAEEAARKQQIAAKKAAEEAKLRVQQQKGDTTASNAAAAADAKEDAARKKKQADAQKAAQAAAAEEARQKQQIAAKKAAEEKKLLLQQQKEDAAAAAASAKEDAARKKKQAESQKAAQTAAAEETRRKKQIEAQKAAVTADEERRKKAIEAQRAAEVKKANAEAEKRKKEAEKRKQEEFKERERRAKEKIAAVKSKVANPGQQGRERAALGLLSNVASRATVALFGLGGRRSDDDDEALPVLPPPPVQKVNKTAPPGVSTISRWRKNADNSVTGLVSGSRGFTDGQRITTSPIQSGTFASGEVVKTGSGSRYFLE